MFRIICCVFIAILASTNLYSNIIDEDIEEREKRSKIIFDRYIIYISEYDKLPPNEILISTAKFFIGKPYVASTLEQNGDEHLVVNLEEFDCTTFVETCIALTLTAISKEPTFENFKYYLQKIRYRGGSIDGYLSRLHYMIDWIADGESKKIFKNISSQLGGERVKKEINFMSAHPELYPKLRNNKFLVSQIADIEMDIALKDYVVISKKEILAASDAILNGDIVIFASAIDGLDYNHLGIVYREKGMLKIIHASSASRKVIIDNRSIDHYCKTTPRNTGVTILRLDSIITH
ncbi:N-acetylmuramoyl-L-alanine amidase-like domain-containing protein [Dysgonomonas massiliensis]|uniref:N-acetylmuramoyl-L-alanine amidase-like domain-containing protein n=1 Tax=Dysgonomonas massiliensis TaxID=2040292 RepID=UPI000C76F2B7|nr:N-acetylmuramoyl-L-alanine amidase-like domain-containing protein [Dysgonomonas massiliensis]